MEQHLGASWEFETRVIFDAPTADVAPYVSGPMGRLEPIDDDHCRLTGSTSNPAMYAGEWLSAMPFEFRVEGGEELRQAVAEVARRMTAAITES